MSAKDYDVIVIGAGPSGLSSAMEAAKNGARTLILDKRSVIGEPKIFLKYLQNSL